MDKVPVKKVKLEHVPSRATHNNSATWTTRLENPLSIAPPPRGWGPRSSWEVRPTFGVNREIDDEVTLVDEVPPVNKVKLKNVPSHAFNNSAMCSTQLENPHPNAPPPLGVRPAFGVCPTWGARPAPWGDHPSPGGACPPWGPRPP